MIKDLLINTLIVIVVFVPLEHLRPIQSEKKIFRKLWKTDAAYLLISSFLVAMGMALILLVSTLLIGSYIPKGFMSAVSTQPIIMQVVEVLIIADFGFYSIHRAFHTLPILWRFHAIHHSIEEMDWLAGHRVHPFDQILTRGLSLVPVFLFGFSDLSIVIFAAIYKWQSHLIHSNVNIPFGPLKWITASPEFHHWHHSTDAAAFDKNFAGQLPIFDILFGTLHMPQDETPKGYGSGDHVPEGFVDQLFHPFKKSSKGLNQEHDQNVIETTLNTKP